LGQVPAAGRDSVDVLIAGGGHVGLSLATALRQSSPRLAVTVVDPVPSAASATDIRASAIAAGGRRLLEALGVWRDIVEEAQPIVDMVITDSRTGDAVRPVFLSFDGRSGDGEPFAHMVPNGVMVSRLRNAALEAGATLIEDGVVDFVASDRTASVRLAGGGQIDAALLVAADGVRSRLRDIAGISVARWSYPQSGIVATVAHERDHGGRAVEHFLPGGPFAILPLKGKRSSLVWTERSDLAERLVAGDAMLFHAELESRFGHQLGEIEVLDKPRAFPLGLLLARDFVKPRFALAGDAVHGIHPIAGQGLNLGFRDVAALAETIVEAERLGLDVGSLAVLSRYERWRRFDTFEMGALTDVLNRLFSNDNPVIRLARDVGLGLVDRVPALKRMLIGEAAADGGELPRLLRGLAI
jgi:2-octaprenyl-6-methoxyphenol hydroxylase